MSRLDSKKKLPVFKTDKKAEDFLDKDLSDYLHMENFARFVFEYQPKQNSLGLQRKTAAENNQHNE